jgi:hypothetical protein
MIIILEKRVIMVSHISEPSAFVTTTKPEQPRQKAVAMLVGFLLIIPLEFASIARAEDPGIGYELDPGQHLPEFYVAIDNQTTLTRGIYAGLPNPNFNRLTLLFAHREENPATNHFHGIGTYTYSGLPANPVVLATNTNNRIPETYTGLSPLTLSRGKGAFENYFVSAATSEEYSNLLLQPIAVLGTSTDPGEQILLNSSAGRWTNSLGNAAISLQLVAISEGLSITNPFGVTILPNIGDIYSIGSGDNFSFLPQFVASRLGRYSATLRLLDTGENIGRSPLGESGTFSFDFQTVPEPSSLVGLGLFGAIFLIRVYAKR